MAPRFVGDDALGYRRAATVFARRRGQGRGHGLTLDESYRLCHLPLVNPGHPDIIAAAPGRDYQMGVHGQVLSLVAPLDGGVLEASASYRALSAELAESPVGPKIAWDLLPRRRDRLHATLGAPGIEGWRTALAALGRIHVRIGGPFSGNVNVGRLYLKLYPEERGGVNMLHAVQDAIGQPRRDLYLVGLWNLTDHLDAGEAGWLADWLRRWGEATLAEIALDALHLLASRDDLVLDARVADVIPLT